MTVKPRSFQQILGGMIDTFMFRTGLKGLRIGSPLLSILEAAATSDTRATQDFFSVMDERDLDRAKGVALERIGFEEGVERNGASPATGYVNFTDTSFNKVETVIYTGAPAPIAGSLSILVADASLFPLAGRLYIGRGTANYEGPLRYSSIERVGSYWRITLDSPTVRFHNTNETVILAQGGDRSIAPGTVVQTSDGSSRYDVVYGAILRDGEVIAENAFVSCQTPGKNGNAVAGAITGFASPPFSGATVTNPNPFVNGAESEPDKIYRERIRRTRQTRAKGTPLALKNAALGVQALDEAKRVVSASVVSMQGEPTVVYIDDGTGYEEANEGIPYEVLIESALGGETLFQLPHKPIAKAFAETSADGPWNISSGAGLAVRVGGVLSVHRFSQEDFRVPSTATAYECVASINANSSLLFAARTSHGQQRIAIFAKSEKNEDIEVVPFLDGEDANQAFAFPNAKIETLKLYVNDQQLNKDGVVPTVRSAPITVWKQFAGTVQLEISVDRTPVQEIVFDANDFVEAGYSVVGHNSLDSWATAFNRKIPGVVTTVEEDHLVLRSARGASNDASIEILGGSLVSAGMFTLDLGLASFGKQSDFSFDRNTGQGRLAQHLTKGDFLTVGTSATTSYIEGERVPGGIVSFTGPATLFGVSIDGDTPIDITVPSSESASLENPVETTLRDVANGLNEVGILLGARFDVKENELFRVYTNTAKNGSIYIESVNSQAELLGLRGGTYSNIDTSHLAFSESGNSENGTPEPETGSRARFAIGPNDDFSVSLGESRSYTFPLYRNIESTDNVYGATFQVADADSDGTLADNFGEAFDWKDFIVYMRARGVAFPLEASKKSLWRFGRFGAEGNSVRVLFAPPREPLAPFEITTQAKSGLSYINIHLPGTDETPGILLSDSARFVVTKPDSNSVKLQSVEPRIRSVQKKEGNGIKFVEAVTEDRHGFVVGDLVYVELDSPLSNYPDGWKVVSEVINETVFCYKEEGLVDTSPVLASGYARFTKEAANLSAVSPNDIVTIRGNNIFGVDYGGVYRITDATANSVTFASTNPKTHSAPIKLGGRQNIRFYKVDTSQTQVSNVVAWVNSNTDILEGYTLDGSGVIDTTTDEADAIILQDGVNSVESIIGGVLTMKNQPELATDFDFTLEDIRLAPSTAKNVAEFMNSPAVSGVYSLARVTTSSQGKRVQILANETGSLGYVRVNGGLANRAVAQIVGNARTTDNYTVVSVLKEQTDGLAGNMWVGIRNSKFIPKYTASAGDTIGIHGGVFTSYGKNLWEQIGAIDSGDVVFSKDGAFAKIEVDISFANILGTLKQGDWVKVDVLKEDYPLQNNGWYRIAFIDDNAIWIDHPDIQEGVFDLTAPSIFFFSSNSVVPGDTLAISTSALGEKNRGSWTIAMHGSTPDSVYVSGLANSVATPIGAKDALGVKIIEGTPSVAYKKIKAINQSVFGNELSDITLHGADKAETVSQAYDSILFALDKLDFDDRLHTGVNGYSVTTGLIAEVSRVLYGDESNPLMYPGVVAASSIVNIQSPLVKRIRTSLTIRQGNADAVRGAVASVINSHGVGEPIALSDIVEAANPYCNSVVITYPVYSVGRDVIPVQAYEKPMVINPQTDISISVIGE